MKRGQRDALAAVVAAEDWRKQVPRARESMGSRSGFNALEGREFEGFTHPKIDVGKGVVPDLSQICHREIGAPGGIRTPDQWLRKPLLYPAELRARFITTFSR